MKVKFLSVMGSSRPQGLTTEGFPTRQASAVLFCFRDFELLREPPEDEDTVEVFRAEFSFWASS